MKEKRAIILFVKYPVLGKVKTRLARYTREQFALEFYKILSDHIFMILDKLGTGTDKYLFYSNSCNSENVKHWVNRDFHFIEQIGADLGEKISNASRTVFDENYNKVLIIGSDIPDISEIVIKRAFDELSLHNVVIAPAFDGGYSLLGTDKYYPELFENIEWSTDTVLKKTIEIIESNQLNHKLLPELNDIDTIQDLSKWIKGYNQSPLAEKIKKLAERENIKI